MTENSHLVLTGSATRISVFNNAVRLLFFHLAGCLASNIQIKIIETFYIKLSFALVLKNWIGFGFDFNNFTQWYWVDLLKSLS